MWSLSIIIVFYVLSKSNSDKGFTQYLNNKYSNKKKIKQDVSAVNEYSKKEMKQNTILIITIGIVVLYEFILFFLNVQL